MGSTGNKGWYILNPHKTTSECNNICIDITEHSILIRWFTQNKKNILVYKLAPDTLYKHQLYLLLIQDLKRFYKINL